MELEELLCDWSEKPVIGSPIIPLEEIRRLQMAMAAATLEQDERQPFSQGLKQSQAEFPAISEKLFAMPEMALMDDLMAASDLQLVEILQGILDNSRVELATYLATNQLPE